MGRKVSCRQAPCPLSMLHPTHLALLAALLPAPTPAQDLFVRDSSALILPGPSPEAPRTSLSIDGIADDLFQLSDGTLLLRRSERGADLFVPSLGQRVWSWDCPDRRQLAGLAPLGPTLSDGVLLGLMRPLQAIEIDALGREQRVTDLGESDGEMHHLAATGRGTYLVCIGGQAMEIEPAASVPRWTYTLPEPAGQVLCALHLEGDQTLLGTGRGIFHLIDGSGKLVRTIGSGDLGGIPLGAITGLQKLADGSIAVLNRSAGEGQPVAFAFDPASAEVHWKRTQAELGGERTQAVFVAGQEASAELLQRARRVHRATLALDTHKDISDQLAAPAPDGLEGDGLEAFGLANDPTRWGYSQVDFPKMRAGGLDVAFYIVYAGQGSLDEEGFGIAANTATAKFDAIHRMCERFPDHIELATSADDVERIAATGKLVACIGIENGYVMGTDIGRIAEFHRRGARYMSLTHNRHSQLGDSYTPDEPLHGGLSELGRQAVVELNRVGILVDVSHSSKDTMMQATALSAAPVIASHSGARAMRDHGRNLDDEQLRALAANGGVVQCVAFSSYVTDTGLRDAAVRAAREELGLGRRFGAGAADTSPEAQAKRRQLRERVAEIEAEYPPSNVADFVNHIDHAVEVAGIEHVAISSDFDGGGGVVGWNNAAETFAVTLELCRRGYSDEDIGKLWSGNTLRIWREVEEVAKRIQGESGK